jgi:hypothetical protein
MHPDADGTFCWRAGSDTGEAYIEGWVLAIAVVLGGHGMTVLDEFGREYFSAHKCI